MSRKIWKFLLSAGLSMFLTLVLCACDENARLSAMTQALEGAALPEGTTLLEIKTECALRETSEYQYYIACGLVRSPLTSDELKTYFYSPYKEKEIDMWNPGIALWERDYIEKKYGISEYLIFVEDIADDGSFVPSGFYTYAGEQPPGYSIQFDFSADDSDDETNYYVLFCFDQKKVWWL